MLFNIPREKHVMSVTTELLPLFARREQLLKRLHGGTQTKTALAESLDISRSTIDRSMRTLATAGMVQREQGGYGLTLTGRLLYEEFRSFSERAESLAAAQRLLSSLPADTELPPEAVVGATVTYPESTAPYRPMERHVEVIRCADEIDLLATAVAPRFIDAYREQVLEGREAGCEGERLGCLVARADRRFDLPAFFVEGKALIGRPGLLGRLPT